MYTWMKSSRNGYRSINYPMTDKEEQSETRVAGIRCGGGIIDTGDAAGIRYQFSQVWAKAGRRVGDIQGYVNVLSFSKNEINADDPDWTDKALDVADEVMRRLRPGTQYIAIAQKDGKGGMAHVHLFNNAIHTESLKALSGRETSKGIFQRVVEEVMEDQGIELDAGKDHSKRKKATAKRRQKHQQETEGYSWMEDLESRIDLAASETTATGDFEQNLKRHGVSVSRKTKSGWTFVLEDPNEIEYRGKKCRYDKLADDLSMKTLNKRFKENFQKAKERQRQIEEERHARWAVTPPGPDQVNEWPEYQEWLADQEYERAMREAEERRKQAAAAEEEAAQADPMDVGDYDPEQDPYMQKILGLTRKARPLPDIKDPDTDRQDEYGG